MNFGQALEAVKSGAKIYREGWNGKGMYLALIAGNTVRQSIADHYGHAGETFPVMDAIYMKTADDKLVPWLASQTDILADDWLAEPIQQPFQSVLLWALANGYPPQADKEALNVRHLQHQTDDERRR